MAKQKEKEEVLGTESLPIEDHFEDTEVYKVKIVKSKNGLVEGDEIEVSGNVANALLKHGVIAI